MSLYRKIFIETTNNTFLQFIRYGFVALISLVVDFGSLVFIKEILHIHYILAAILAFIGGLIVNYTLSRMWVFHSSKLDNRKKEFFIFSVIGIIGLLLTTLILWILTDIFGIYYIISKIIATILIYFWNFGIRKKVLFN